MPLTKQKEAQDKDDIWFGLDICLVSFN